MNVTVFQKIPKPLGIGAIQRTKEILPLDTVTSGNSGVYLEDPLINVLAIQLPDARHKLTCDGW